MIYRHRVPQDGVSRSVCTAMVVKNFVGGPLHITLCVRIVELKLGSNPIFFFSRMDTDTFNGSAS